MTDSDGNVFFVFLLAFIVSVWPRIVAAYDGDGNVYMSLQGEPRTAGNFPPITICRDNVLPAYYNL